MEEVINEILIREVETKNIMTKSSLPVGGYSVNPYAVSYTHLLVKLREREEQLQKDQLDGLDVYVAGKADVNFLFDRYISTKTELRSTCLLYTSRCV